MGSAWNDIEEKVASTIGSLVVELGFAEAATPPEPQTGAVNVHRYLPEHEHSSLLESYYYADVVGGKREIRAWAVVCNQSLVFETFNTTTLDLDCEVFAFYSKGSRGAGRLLLMNHMSAVHQALRALTTNLDGTCSLIRDWSKVAIGASAVQSDKVEGEILIGRFVIRCQSANMTP